MPGQSEYQGGRGMVIFLEECSKIFSPLDPTFHDHKNVLFAQCLLVFLLGSCSLSLHIVIVIIVIIVVIAIIIFAFSLECVVPGSIHTTPNGRLLEIPKGRGLLSELNLNFRRSGSSNQNAFHGGSTVWIFSERTQYMTC